MRILETKNRFNTKFTLQKEWIPVINFETAYQNSILKQYAKLTNANEDMLKLLKFFNKNIFDVNMQLRSYSVHYNGEDELLAITNLSRGEKFLAMCLMADRTKSKVYLSGEISQLAKPTLLKLIEMFKDSKYINIVPPNDMYTYMLRSLLRQKE